MKTVQATVVAKEKIRHKHLYFILLCRNIFYCRKFFKDALVLLLNRKEWVDSRGADSTSGNGCC